MLAKRGLLATQWPARLAGPNANIRPNVDCRPNARCRPQRELPAGCELPAKRNLLAQTQFAGTKNKVTEFFSFGASDIDHDDVFSIPAALGGAEAYLVRWLASNRHLLGCSGDNHPLISLEGLRFGPSISPTCALVASFGRRAQAGRVPQSARWCSGLVVTWLLAIADVDCSHMHRCMLLCSRGTLIGRGETLLSYAEPIATCSPLSEKHALGI